MHRGILIHSLLVVTLFFLLAEPACAYKRESRIPLSGCRGHFAASGSARFVAMRNEPRQTDHEELIIEIKNVPLRPGTKLIVYVSDDPVGSISLNAKQSGSLTLTSSFGKVVPEITAGTSVMIKTIDGRDVMW